MASTLTKADVLRIAELARVELSEQDVEMFTTQLADILHYAEQVQEVNTDGVAPTSHPVPLDAAWRADVVVPSLSTADALANAPDKDSQAGLFKVPKVL